MFQKGVFRSSGERGPKICFWRGEAVLFPSRIALTVATGLSVSSNGMAWHAPISKTLGNYLRYLSVQPGLQLPLSHDILHGISASWCQSDEDFHRWYT